MYDSGTILSRKRPRSTPRKPFAYDRVRVIGASPVVHPSMAGHWTGANGQGVVIQPLTEFAGNVDTPFGRLQEDYDVESVPESIIRPQEIHVIRSNSTSAGPSPEEYFAKVARGEA